MGVWSSWRAAAAKKKACSIAKCEPHRAHGSLTCPETPACSLNLSHETCDDPQGHSELINKLCQAENLTASSHQREISNGRRGTRMLLLVFCSTLLIIEWKLWPHYNAQLKEANRDSSPPGGRSINEIDFILNQLRENGTTPCHNVHTNFTKIFDLRFDSFDPTAAPVTLSTNALHIVLMDSYSQEGRIRCSGGDFYETILYNNNWRSRPKVQDFGNGSYGISFFVDLGFEGLFNFSASLLFGNFHGLESMTRSWDVHAQVAFFQVEFFYVHVGMASQAGHPDLPSKLKMMDLDAPQPFSMCNMKDNFQQMEWNGRWTRELANDSCMPNDEGRFLECVSTQHENCSQLGQFGGDKCSGRLSRLESNGWVYSQASCGFHIYDAQEAWDCLSGHWLLFWGDSNFQDTIRNLMLFVLDIPVPYWSTLSTFQLPRNFEEYFINPDRPDQSIHVSLVYNGHFSVWDGHLGLDSLEDSTYRKYIARHFTGKSLWPDTIIMNSGLHDGMHFNSVASYVAGVHRAVDFWKELLEGLPPSSRSQVVYRTTVAPAGESRGMQSNPHKMEVFNKVMVEGLLASIPSARIVDAFDITFPFHFNNDYSDGGHYGRAPKADLKPWFGQPHQYFVDLMLVHVLLNSVCPMPS